MSRTSGNPLWVPKLPRYKTTTRFSQLNQSQAQTMGQTPSQEAQTGANGDPERRFLRRDLSVSLAYTLQL
jgi:hypothetical protein